MIQKTEEYKSEDQKEIVNGSTSTERRAQSVTKPPPRMLIFVNLLGAVRGKKLPLDVQPTTTVQEVQTLILQTLGRPDLSVQRLLFSGRILKPEQTLQSFHVRKESILQCLLRRKPTAPSSAALEGKADDIPAAENSAEDTEREEKEEEVCDDHLRRRRSSLELPIGFGEIVLLQLKEIRMTAAVQRPAEEGKETQEEKEEETGTLAESELYAVINYREQEVARSNLAQTDRHGFANWKGQVFGFLLPDEEESPSRAYLILWSSSSSTSSPGSIVGLLDLDFRDIPPNGGMDNYFTLRNSPAGAEVLLALRRTTLSSQALRDRVEALCSLQQAWTPKHLQQQGLSTIAQILGQEPWNPEEEDGVGGGEGDDPETTEPGVFGHLARMMGFPRPRRATVAPPEEAESKCELEPPFIFLFLFVSLCWLFSCLLLICLCFHSIGSVPSVVADTIIIPQREMLMHHPWRLWSWKISIRRLLPAERLSGATLHSWISSDSSRPVTCSTPSHHRLPAQSQARGSSSRIQRLQPGSVTPWRVKGCS